MLTYPTHRKRPHCPVPVDSPRLDAPLLLYGINLRLDPFLPPQICPILNIVVEVAHLDWRLASMCPWRQNGGIVHGCCSWNCNYLRLVEITRLEARVDYALLRYVYLFAVFVCISINSPFLPSNQGSTLLLASWLSLSFPLSSTCRFSGSTLRFCLRPVPAMSSCRPPFRFVLYLCVRDYYQEGATRWIFTRRITDRH